MSATKIQSALAQLDPTKDAEWTSDGLPRLDSVKALVGDPLLTRDNVTAAWPGFTRTVRGIPPTTHTEVAPIVAPVEPTSPQTPEATVLLQEESLPTFEITDKLDEARYELELAQRQLVETDKYLAEGNASRKKLLVKIDALSAEVDKLSPADTNTDAIQSYLASQRAILTARGEQHAKVRAFEKEHGFKLAQLLPKRAPLDMAMARKNGRGGNRPGSK